MKFLNIKTDYAFKKVFGTEGNKDILIKFLNSVIEFPLLNKIKDLTIVDPYNIPMLKGMKDSFVDIKAILDDDTKVIIEMQVLNHEGFEKRVLYNAAKNYSVQLDSSDKYHLLNPVIALNIVDFVMFKDTNNVVTNFKMLEKREFISYNDDIELIFIELPKFTKDLNSLDTLQDEWLYFIKNAESLEYIPQNLDTSIIKALNTANEANLTKDELELQHKRQEFISIQKLAIIQADKKGREEGKEQGIEQGKKEMIKKLFQAGVDLSIISQTTGFSISKIEIFLK